jgi:PAS domain S-box-containing protein
LGDRLYTSQLSLAALGTVLLALACAAFLHVRAWYVGRKGVYATEREFTSVYQHALDGILILDERGVCLDANPAAFALLGAPPAVLVGHSFAQFYSDRTEFEREWHSFLESGYQRRQAQLFRPNGSKVFVHFANDSYTKQCKDSGIKIHPARFPTLLPRFFIKTLTDVGDSVVDRFAGSNTKGAVAESLNRRWIANEAVEEDLKASTFRFEDPEKQPDARQVSLF